MASSMTGRKCWSGPGSKGVPTGDEAKEVYLGKQFGKKGKKRKLN